MVFLGSQALQPRLAGVNDEAATATLLTDLLDEVGQRGLAVLIIDPDPALDGNGDADGIAHGGDVVGNQPQLRHKASTEGADLSTAIWIDGSFCAGNSIGRCQQDEDRRLLPPSDGLVYVDPNEMMFTLR